MRRIDGRNCEWRNGTAVAFGGVMHNRHSFRYATLDGDQLLHVHGGDDEGDGGGGGGGGGGGDGGGDYGGTTQTFDDGSTMQSFDDGSTLAMGNDGSYSASPA